MYPNLIVNPYLLGMNASRIQLIADTMGLAIEHGNCFGDLYRKLPQQIKHYIHDRHLVKPTVKHEQDTYYHIDR